MSKMSELSDTKVLNEVPASMQKLARYVVRGFYGVEHGIIIDLLIRNVCMLEDQLRSVLRFDPKQLRTILIQLKNDKIIKERQLLQERPDSRPIKHNYYFIQYRALINVVKYKFDHMRKKLETEEKTTTHRAMYKCTRCQKTYSDLEINLLWTGDEMQCTYCHGLVEEDVAAGPNQATRSSLARFNEQMWPFFTLLQQLDGCQLAQHLLEPIPQLPAATDRDGAGADGLAASGAGDGGHEGRKADFDIYKHGFEVNIEGAEDAAKAANLAAAGPKEVPVWMQTSTVHTENAAEDHVAPFTLGMPDSVSPTHVMQHQDIAQTLLVHESKPASSTAGATFSLEPNDESLDEKPAQKPATTVGATSDESEFEDVEEDELMVTVQGKQVSFSDLTENPHLISAMTPEEKQHYIRISQQAFESVNG